MPIVLERLCPPATSTSNCNSNSFCHNREGRRSGSSKCLLLYIMKFFSITKIVTLNSNIFEQYYDLDGIRIFKRKSHWWRLSLMVLFLGGIFNMLSIMNYLHLSQHEDEKIFAQPTSSANDPITIEIVLAYCSSPLTWVEKDVIQDTLKTFLHASFHFTIMSKCGK